jgi:hypothetical protein
VVAVADIPDLDLVHRARHLFTVASYEREGAFLLEQEMHGVVDLRGLEIQLRRDFLDEVRLDHERFLESKEMGLDA